MLRVYVRHGTKSFDEIWSFHDGKDKYYCLPGYVNVQPCWLSLTFQEKHNASIFRRQYVGNHLHAYRVS